MLPSAPSPTIDYPVFEFPWDIPPSEYEYDPEIVYDDDYEIEEDDLDIEDDYEPLPA